ncbi:DUF1415 domain-containing protein [Lacisediminimonas profundi]|uniref:DUF1415 domain-containing protein n=1 Tax=Lacisediminimonas profundi TaxID=2603856 RepID=UPI00124AF50E|nr:DUF1415 domain-containing protein [Lacisediminimonas profundi]
MNDENKLMDDTRRWVEEAVIGLNLCPFAKAVQARGQIRYTLSQARDPEALTAELLAALHDLAAADPEQLDTILLIHPFVLEDFAEYNDYLDIVDMIIEAEGYEGVLQVASFHPDYQFADSPAADRANYTNRSPYPMLHLLREDSISRAVDSLPDPASVYQRNMRVLRDLPQDEFARIWGPRPER